jgi:hypothetical protein
LGCSAWCRKNIFVVTKVNFSPHHNRVPDQLTKSECGIYINLQGKLSRTEIIEFVGKASSAAFTSSYIGFIILFHEDFVEVRDSRDGALVQVVAGQDIRCIDDGQGRNEKRRVLMAMAHPDLDGRQLVLELRVKDLYFSRRNPA